MKHRSASDVGEKEADKARGRVHFLLSAVFWLVLFEGALRKWGPQSLSTPLYFVRDPFVLGAYIIAIKHRLFPKHWLITILLVLSFCLVVLGLVDILAISESPFVVALGIRSYLLYAFMAFLWPTTMTSYQFQKLWKRVLLFCIPMAALIFAQYHSSPTSRINTLIHGEVSEFVTGGHARPTGTFSFILGQSVFDILAVAIVLGELYKHKNQRIASNALTVSATAAVLVAVSFSVSRTAAVGTGICLAGAIVSSLIPGRGRKFSLVKSFGPVFILIIAITGIILFFPEGIATLMERHEGAVSSEGSEASRAVDMLVGAGDHSLNLSALGVGIGRGSPVAIIFTKGNPGLYLSEYEIPRTLQELGVFVGSAYLLFRAILAAYLLNLGLKMLRYLGDPSVFILAVFCTVELIGGDVETNPSVGGVVWVAVALTLAAAKTGVIMQRQKKLELT